MPNLDGESYSDVTLSFLCLIFRLSSCLILFYFILFILSRLVSSRLVLLSCVACACSVFFFVMCVVRAFLVFFFTFFFSCFLLFSPFLCFCLLSAAFSAF